MRLILTMIALVYTLMAANAEDAAFALDFEEEYKTALAKANKENKLLMLLIVQEPCPYCDRLVENTLSDAEVKKGLKNFVSVVIDKKGDFPEAFKTNITPMTFFIDPKTEESVWESMGYVKVPQFLDDLKEAQLMRKSIK